MACLDLQYYVTVHENLKKRPEQKETHLPIALGDLQQGEGASDSKNSECTACLCIPLWYTKQSYKVSLKLLMAQYIFFV